MLRNAFRLRHWAALGFVVVVAAACMPRQEAQVLESHPQEIAPIRTVAIATIAARPSLSAPLFARYRGELVSVLGKFETELTESLLARGYNVIPVGESKLIYNDPNLEYETAYLHNSPDFMARMKGEEEFSGIARKLRADSNKLLGAISDDGRFVDEHDKIDQITSPNTRIFPELGVGFRFMLPRHTEGGGSADSRFMSEASRAAIGEMTRDMGADAYILVDANLLLSARQEGYVLTGLTGGTRYATMDGVAAMVRNDGAILSIDWFRGQASLPVGGITQRPFTTERGSGIIGFHKHIDRANLLEGSYQAIRIAARDLAARYAEYREKGRKILAEIAAEKAKREQEILEKEAEARKKAPPIPDAPPSEQALPQYPMAQ